MVDWVVDDGAYRQAYLDTVARAQTLDGDLRKLISRPAIISLTPEYQGSHHKIMIMGQETYGSNLPLAGESPEAAYKMSIYGYHAFNHAEDAEPKTRTSPFWRAFRAVCGRLGLAAPRGAAWSNLIKVQRCTGAATSFLSLNAQQRVDVLAWQRNLFAAELTFAKPKKLVLFTGPHYDRALRAMIPDLNLNRVDGFAPNLLLSGKSAIYGCDVARTYHPAYLQRIGKFDEMIEVIARV